MANKISNTPAGKKLAKLLAKQIPPTKVDGHLRRAAVANQLPDAKAFAKATGLKYVNDTSPGITRVKHGKDFSYTLPNGKPLRDPETLRRIRSLVIPPAWTDVWICPLAEGHIQATGKDARGRKQYRYHTRWRTTRDETKFHRLIAFGKALTRIRRATHKHLRLKGLPKDKVLAVIVQLLEKTSIRVGNAEYAKSNESFGLTTILDDHARIDSKSIRFEFKGKSGVSHDIELRDPRLAKIVKQCQDLPGQELFAYEGPSGKWADITSSDVNDYIKRIAGAEFTAKDFRTWNGTVLAAKALQEIAAYNNQSQARKNVVRAVEKVAGRLGNTKSVCRKCYVHPAVIDAYLDGSLLKILEEQARREMSNIENLQPEEAAVLAFLQQRLRKESARSN